jgi:hypothetical protein
MGAVLCCSVRALGAIRGKPANTQAKAHTFAFYLPSLFLYYNLSLSSFHLNFPEFPFISFVVYRLWNSREYVFWPSFLFSFCYYLFKNYKKESSRNANGSIH